MMTWQNMVMFLSAIMVPLAMIAGGWIADRRSKKQFSVTSQQTEKQVQATAKEAANHEFEAITAGFTELTSGLRSTITRLETQNSKLEGLIRDMDSRFQELNRRHQLALDHMDVLEEQLAPYATVPRRPKGMGET